MNTYERIINILLEARFDMFIQDRLDEKSEQARKNRAAVKAWQASGDYKPPESEKVGREEAKTSNRARRAADISKPGSGEGASKLALMRRMGARKK
jgi:hypothetical protein